MDKINKSLSELNENEQNFNLSKFENLNIDTYEMTYVI